ncbi:MAG: DUF4830 domain-containing protein [Clostridia bacterium]|nr:DUF4830 domain-containing protein [Clostridia bacterium]
MFIYSVRASTLKFFGGVILSVVTLITLICLIPTVDTEDAQTFSPGEKINYSGIKSNDDRINFLKQFGWEAEPSPTKEETVTIPDDFDRVYTGYNEIQKSMGLDLSKYKNKEVIRYCYKITNYPDYDGEVIATLLIYRNKVIGGDISSADANGFTQGFEKSTS